MSGTIGKTTFQGRRLIKWKLYEKRVQREKGKCPTHITKYFIIKEGKSGICHRKKQERHKKLSLTKVATMGLRRAQFPSLMNDMDKETTHKGPYLPIAQGGCICG